MLPAEELKALSRPSGLRSSVSLFLDWALIAGGFALAILAPHPLAWIFCFLLLSRQQLALAILMHDGAHRRLYKSAAVNDWICQLLCAAPLFFSMYSYQRLHLKHHRAPLAADDPDLSLVGGYPISKASFARKLLRDAFGVSYFKFIRYFLHMARKPRRNPKRNPTLAPAS
jgi:fatty acid desaturase